jgi:hypothetical protein
LVQIAEVPQVPYYLARSVEYWRQLVGLILQKNRKSRIINGAGWSSLVARRAHNPKVVSSNLTPATISKACLRIGLRDE